MNKGYEAFIVFFTGMFLLFLSFHPNDAVGTRNALIVLPDGREIMAEIADTEQSRSKGLMFREHLDPGCGMLFIFEEEGFHWMWMKNCKIPLDIIWLSQEGKIIHIENSVPPCIEGENCRTVGPFKRSLYVLELKAGTALQSSLKQGDELIIVWIKAEER